MKRLAVIVQVIVATVPTTGLIAGDGSVYSRFGVGDIITYVSSRTVGMGGAGLALLTDGYINGANPAALGRITRTQYSGDFQYQGFEMNDGSTSSFLSAGNFQGAALAFPLAREYNLVFAFGIAPFSRSAYSVRDDQLQGGQEIIQTYDGTGGLSSAQFSVCFSPHRDLFVGVTSHYLFGRFNHRQRLEFANKEYFVSDVERETSMDGFAFTIGGAYAGIDRALGISDSKKLDVAAAVFGGASLSTDESRIEDYVSSKETTGVRSGSTTIPLHVSVGASYLFDEKMVFTGDIQMQLWDNFRYFGAHPAGIRNSVRFGVGVEFFPTRSPGEPYIRQVTYRAGSYVNSSYLRVNGQPINEYFVTGGLGLPIFFTAGSDARLNVSLEYGVRGTRSHGLQRDSITRLTVSLSGSDTWFIPPEIE